MKKFLFLFLFPTSFQDPLRPCLYLHLDKSVYTGHEIIWFTGYVLHLDSTNMGHYSVLFVNLINPTTKKVAVSSRFVMDKGICQGVLQLPDSIAAGEYSFIAYTDHLFSQGDDPVFQQWISVRYNTSLPRQFYHHPDEASAEKLMTKVDLIPDSGAYNNRSMTRWKVKISDSSGKPVTGIFSVSCVRSTRLRHREPDINEYDKTSYYVPHLLSDSIAPFILQVGLGNRPKLKGAVQLLVTHDPKFELINTDKDGSIQLNPAYLYSTYGNPATFTVMEKRYQGLYRIKVVEQDSLLNIRLALREFPAELMPLDTFSVFTSEEDMDNKKLLTAVIVKQRRRADFEHPEYYDLPVMSGPCAAWVCSCGHWKCGGCQPLFSPVKGEWYEDMEKHIIFKYTGCPIDSMPKPFIAKVNPINYPPPFQTIDFGHEHPDGLFYNTTLFWDYLIATDEKGEAAFQFYTNDLIGHFTTTIEGVSSGGYIVGKREFTVAKKNNY